MCFNTQGLYKCGKCPECLQERRLQWSIRLMAQHRATPAFSALLTYNNEHVPLTKDGQMSLRKSDLQKFFKRLRHHEDFKNIKYFACAEYSPEKFRPHYHILFFGIDKNLEEKEIIKILQATWRNGFVGNRSRFVRHDAQIHYVTGYLINLYGWKKDDSREKPFNLISKGLGMNFSSLIPELNIERIKEINSQYRWYYDKELHQMFFDAPIYFDEMSRSVKLYDDFHNLAYLNDCVKIQQTKYNIHNGSSQLGAVKSFPMPRVWRYKIFSPFVREILNNVKEIDAFHRAARYYEKYKDYDATHERPMWQELKLYKWSQRKKSKKDKLLQNPDFYIL